MTKSSSTRSIVGRYSRLNFVFWLSIFGIVLGPILALVVSVVVFKLAGSGASAPIGLTAPLWSIVAVAVALFTRGPRKAARRARDLAILGESLGMTYAAKAPPEALSLLKAISFMENPLEQKGVNYLQGAPSGRSLFSLDYTYCYFYGAVSIVGDQTMVVFPGATARLPWFTTVPLGVMDQLADSLLGRGGRIQLPAADAMTVEFNRQFATVGDDPKSVAACLSPQLVHLLLQDRSLTVAVEQGHLLIFRQLRFVEPRDYQAFLSTAVQVAQLLS